MTLEELGQEGQLVRQYDLRRLRAGSIVSEEPDGGVGLALISDHSESLSRRDAKSNLTLEYPATPRARLLGTTARAVFVSTPTHIHITTLQHCHTFVIIYHTWLNTWMSVDPFLRCIVQLDSRAPHGGPATCIPVSIEGSESSPQ